MKKLIAILLCLCLLLPTMPIVSAGETYGGYVLQELGYRINASGTSSMSIGQTFDPIDLSQYGCHQLNGGKTIIESGKLAIQLDAYVTGDPALASCFRGGYDGQVEMTSSGTCDKNELMGTAGSLVKFDFGKWKRYTMDLSSFNITTGGDIDITKWNYLRIYFSIANYTGKSFDMKICNVRLVDLTKQAPSTDEDPVGDGTFTPDEPEWRVVDTPDGYDVGETIVAGYDLAEYVEEHKDETKVKQCLGKDDYAPIIQSLIDGLSAAGGGALYIPAGHWSCRSEFEIKSGVTVYGDWKAPDGSPVSGTILDIYAGKNSVSGTPCVTLSGKSSIQYMTFWYPEQTFTNPTPYTPTVGLGGYTIARRLTFVNSYTALRHGPTFANCPNVTEVYGTPLSTGMDLDCIIDIGRFENVNFAPDYWINSGLEGAPTSEEDQQALRNYLYYNATGAAMARIDWSYMTFLNVEGYATGLAFKTTSAGSPNGQCLNLHFKNCQTGLYVMAVTTCGEMIANSTFEGCGTGVWLGETATPDTSSDAILHLINCDIDAENYAVRNQQGTMVQILSSTIRSGEVNASYGWYNLINTKFESEAPQVYLENGTLAANIMGCTDQKGKKITVENEGFCPVTNNSAVAEVPAVPEYTDEEAMAQERHVASDKVFLVQDLDNTGATDVTAALQAKLDAAKTAGGGIVYLIPGAYRLNNQITVPTGVELRGAVDVPHHYLTNSTALKIYADGKTEPAIIMEESSGMRGIDINYPEQANNDAYRTKQQFTPYPYTIQGRGKDIYIINVALSNSWDGVDLMTYRCDNHYVEFLGGCPYHNFIAVGGGSENGILRNCHINISSLTATCSAASFEIDMYKQLQNNAPMYVVGNAKNELLYDCFNYGGYAGIQFVGEEDGAATARVIGCAMDYTTVCLDVQQAESVDVLNLQMVAYNFKLGDALLKPMYHIQLGEEFTGTVNVTGCLFWANPTWCVNVQNGTLNINGLNYFTTDTNFALVSDKGTINVWAPYLKRPNTVKLAVEHPDRIHLISGFYNKMPYGANEVAEFTDMMYRSLRWDMPQSRVDTTDVRDVIFAEAFTDPYVNPTFAKASSGITTATFKSGYATLNAATASAVTITGAGTNGGFTNSGRTLTGGTDTSRYHLVTRVRMDKLSETARFMPVLTTSEGTTLSPVVFCADGSVNVIGPDGSEVKLADYAIGDWYRVTVDIDMTDETAKTCTVTLYDDEGEVVASGEAGLLPENIQEEGVEITNLSFMCLCDRGAISVDEASVMTIDYAFIHADVKDGLLGDVNGDEKVDSTDARMILQYYAKKIGEGDLDLSVADVNADGKIDSTDARLILQLYAKKITEFPAA